MDEQRRRRYLAAMGIPLWLARAADLDVADDAEVAPPAAAPAPPDLPGLLADPADAVDTLDWAALQQRVARCAAYADLLANRTRTVFGCGDRAADLMLIGEAPGVDEDRQGEPFVGRAGQLLNRMLGAMGFAREQVFIANVLKCRPPGNRDPHADEAARCEPFLLRQVALVAPRAMLAVGRIAAQHLLKTDAPVGQLRGRLHYYGERRIPLIVTYHPAYLLRSPEQKPKAWSDLQLLLKVLREAT